jgi:phage-related protein
MDLFELLGKVRIDNSKAHEELDKTSKKGTETESKLSKVFTGIGKGAAAMGKAVASGMAVASAAMGALVVKSLQLTGELEQNMGGSEAVFGEHAANMQEIAKQAFSNMGLSTSEFLGTANKMGALFQGVGFSVEESMNLTADAMQRAADVASIMGIDTAFAMESIAGAAKGNFEMMDNLGVAINDTALQNYALEKGITKSTQAMSTQEKVGLAMEMFLEKTTYAAGNYAKENMTLAGALGTAKAALKNFLDGSGDVDQFTQSFKNLVSVVIQSVKEIAPRLIEGITEIFEEIISILPEMLEELLPVLIDGAVRLIEGVVEAMPMIIAVLMDAMPALIDGITQIITTLIESLPQIIQPLLNALPTLIPLLIEAAYKMVAALCGSLTDIILPLIQALPDIIGSISAGLIKNLPILIKGVTQLIVELVANMPQIIMGLIEYMPKILYQIAEALWEALPELIASIGEMIVSLGAAVWDFLADSFGALAEWFGDIFKAAWEAIQDAWSAVVGWFQDIWDGICKIFEGAAAWFGSIFQAVADAIKAAIDAVFGWIIDLWNWICDVMGWTSDKVTLTAQEAAAGINSAFNSTLPGVKQAANTMLSYFQDLASKTKGVFSGIASAIASSIQSAASSASSSGGGWFTSISAKLPKMATGGVVNRPTIAQIGEAGREAVVPLENNTGWIRQIAGQLHEYSLDMRSEFAAVVPVQTDSTQQQAAKLEALNEKLTVVVAFLGEYFPQMLEKMHQYMVLDTGVLVAETAEDMDAELGRVAARKERGQ